MNIKKLLILPLAFITITIIDIACGDRCEELAKKKYILYKKGSTTIYNGTSKLLENETYTKDTLKVYNRFDQECIVKQKFSLFSSAYAVNPPNCLCGELGTKQKPTKLIITSNATFNGVAAGGSLNSMVTFPRYKDSTTTFYYTSTQFIDSLAAKRYYTQIENFQLNILPKPTTAFAGKFFIKLVFGNTDTVTNETVKFNWN